jgi:hypothetical protein
MKSFINCMLHQILLDWSYQGGWDGSCSSRRRDEKCIKMFYKSEGKRPLGKHRGRWWDNTKMDLTEIGWESVDWMYLAQDRDQWWAVVNTVINLRVPWKARNFLTSWVTISFWRRDCAPWSLTVTVGLCLHFGECRTDFYRRPDRVKM